MKLKKGGGVNTPGKLPAEDYSVVKKAKERGKKWAARAKKSGRGAPQEKAEKWDKKTLNGDSSEWRSKENEGGMGSEWERKTSKISIKIKLWKLQQISSAFGRQHKLIHCRPQPSSFQLTVQFKKNHFQRLLVRTRTTQLLIRGSVAF